MKKVGIILINYRDYAEKYLAECFASLGAQDYKGEIKIFIVDNETSEKSYMTIKNIVETQNFASLQVEIICNEKNDGFAKGNNDAIKSAMEQGYEYIILFNIDTVVETNCVSEMIKAAEKSPPPPLYKGGSIGAVQARLMLWDDKEKINSLGNITHFLGFGYSDGYSEEWDSEKIENLKFKIKNYICYPSGAAVLFKADVLKKVGLFDEEFWMYNEDQDLGWRLWLAGYQCVLAPAAVAYHKYEFSRSIKKYYFMDRNRILAMLKNYHWLTILLVLPAGLIMELGLLAFSLSNGWFRGKLRVYGYFLRFKNWRHIIKARRAIQKSRKAKDKEIIKMFSGRIWYQEISGAKLKIANLFFNIYWNVVKLFIVW